jgi:hypothetical protein
MQCVSHKSSGASIQHYHQNPSKPCDWIINPSRRLQYPGLAERELLLAFSAKAELVSDRPWRREASKP